MKDTTIAREEQAFQAEQRRKRPARLVAVAKADSSLTAPQLSERFGLSVDHVCQTLRRAGVKPAPARDNMAQYRRTSGGARMPWMFYGRTP